MEQRCCGGGSCCGNSASCESVVCQSVAISLPLSFEPGVRVGKMKVMCYDEPAVTVNKSSCDTCRCEITITQKLVYKIPIEYSIESKIREIMCDCQESP